MQALALLLVVIVPWLLAEAVRSRRHETALRARGAVEPPDDVYRWMQVVYPGMFVAMTVEGMLGGPGPLPLVAAGVGVFMAGKLLKWWAILTLGPLWSFRVLVVPGERLLTGGPYRYMRHPNYVGLIGEIIGTAMMMAAPVTGVLSFVVFGLLLRARIAAEERALGIRP
ncbi:MAG TPA: isoprenylcysteine carboxylmethyltransferase family protein [Vicinamibacterales bacterium]